MPNQVVSNANNLPGNVINQATGLVNGPLTSNDIQILMQNPFSLVRQALMSFITAEWNKEIMENIATKLETARLLAQQLMRMYNYQSPSNANLGNSPQNDPNLTHLLNQNQSLQSELSAEKSSLDNLYQRRDALLQPMVNDWQNLQQKQVTRLTNDLNGMLNSMGLNNLTAKDQAILSNVAKGQQIQLTHPELIPPNANPQTVNDKAQTNLEINALRIIAAKQDPSANGDPDNIVALKPSQVKALQQGGFGQIINNHNKSIVNEDNQLLQAQQHQAAELAAINNDIHQHSNTLNSIEATATNNLNQVSNLHLTPRPQPSPNQSTQDFLNSLEGMYDSAKKPNMSTADQQRAFEFNFTQSVKSLDEGQQNQLWQSLDKHAENLMQNPKNYSAQQQQLLIAALGVRDELAPNYANQKTQTNSNNPALNPRNQ